MEISKIIKSQAEFFATGTTKNYLFRKQQLQLLEKTIKENTDAILNAFLQDLNKCEFDAVTTEISLVIKEIHYFIKHLKRLIKPKRVSTSIMSFPSYGKIIQEPFGKVLIMAPWNYPFQLTLCPLIAAIATGNTVVVKPSAYTPTVSKIIEQILSVFPSEYIATITGGREQNQELLNQPFDFIFFTGSKSVGKVVLEKASANLTPVVLELGGKSPCIVDKSANLKNSVRRIVWGKFLNAGQTCIAPDYILVHQDIYEDFIKLAQQQIKDFYYINNEINSNFMHIVNDKHSDRLMSYIDTNKLVCGGLRKEKLIEPTILRDVTFNDKVMQEEIFGPIMPIIKYENIDNILSYINSNDKPLALYIFSTNKNFIKRVLYNTSSGGACVNDVIMHFTEHNLPFGGVGASGMGNYHAKQSFYTFSHPKSVLVKSAKYEIMLKYPPYTKNKQSFVYNFLRFKH